MNKIFVTGAQGMLGNSICRELLHRGYAVKALCYDANNHTLDPLDLERVYGDILDSGFLEREMWGCSFVIHVAALTTVWPRRSTIIKSVNISGTRNVIRAVKNCRIERMVHIGSACTFAPGKKDCPGDEQSALNAWKFGMDYIESKYEVQRILTEEHEKNGLPVITISPTFMIGPYDSGPSSGKLVISYCNQTLPGYTRGGKNFVYSKDVAVAAVNALTQGRTGHCYIAGAHNLSYEEFFRLMAKETKVSFNLRPLPGLLVMAAGAASSALSRISGKPPLLSFGMARMALVEQYFSSDKARTELGMPQTPIAVAVKECVEWFNENGYLK